MPMVALANVPTNADVYIDANILIYAMLGTGTECRAFIGRCGVDINGYSDARVLHDATHKLMCAEAGCNAGQLKKNPARIKLLTKWQNQISVVRRLALPEDREKIAAATNNAQPHVSLLRRIDVVQWMLNREHSIRPKAMAWIPHHSTDS